MPRNFREGGDMPETNPKNLQQFLAEKQAELDKKQKEHAVLESKQEDLESKVKSKESTIASLQQEIDDLNSKIRNLNDPELEDAISKLEFEIGQPQTYESSLVKFVELLREGGLAGMATSCLSCLILTSLL